ncbi:putative baseplate assembly protein [Streptomyces durhamensis]|uniref:putative baseplate assembly protein n=1 Tax=Streptomyces durhamensis TaxID=68194 RepID=UPI0004CCE562|nr:putative baseplate assembly protein [Streptomyces durhamensis]
MTDAILPPSPLSRRRAELITEEGRGNGIDYVEVDPTDHTRLTVGVLSDLPTGGDPWQLVSQPDRVLVKGGERVRAIRTLTVAVHDPRTLDVRVDRGGDHSTYQLELAVTDLDPVLRRIGFSFMAACPSDLDCRPPGEADDPAGPEPLLDTLAKDFASFRRLLLDLSAQRHPSLSDQHPADLAITLLELLAFHADQLSYAQDATALEAYLDTARRRVSVRRHLTLVDYRLHQGRNAATAVHLAVTAPVTVPAGTRVLTRIPGPLPGTSTAPPVAVPAGLLTPAALQLPPLSGSVVFETTHRLKAHPRGNLLHVHHWGEDVFRLPPGATTAWLWAEDRAQPSTAVLPRLTVGDLLLLEQVRSPGTGAPADADPTARWVVRLTDVQPGSDPAYLADYGRDSEGQVQLAERTDDTSPALPLLAVRWAETDAPDRAVCVRAVRADGDPVPDVSVARGNLVLADHGITHDGVDVRPQDWSPTAAGPLGGPPPLRLRLPDAPLTHQIGALGAERTQLTGGPEDAVPALSVTARPGSGRDQVYTPVPDLLDSGPNDLHLVVEVDDTGHGLVRFGDGTLGRPPLEASTFLARYRTGNGTAGNVGAESLIHIGLAAADTGKVETVRNPLPATGGTEPETTEHARQLAPDAYRSHSERAVTERDAVDAVLRLPSVRAAVAALRWTGSWYTWLIAAHPTDPADLVDTGGSHQELSAGLRARILAAMDAVRLAGQDVDVRPPWFVPVELELHVCAAAGHSRSVVRHAVRDALLARRLPGGRPGLLAPATLTFGQPLLLGELYATVAAVPGVDSVKAVLLRRYDQSDNGELAAGRLDVAPWEVLRLDDDPSLPGRGVLRLDMDGGTP